MKIIKYLELMNYNYYILKLVGCNILGGTKEGRKEINVVSIH